MATQTAAITAAVDAAVDFTGGTLGGVATVLVGQPLDTVKVSFSLLSHCLVNIRAMINKENTQY